MKQKILFLIAVITIVLVLILSATYIDKQTKSYLNSENIINSGDSTFSGELGSKNTVINEEIVEEESSNIQEILPKESGDTVKIIQINAQEFEELVSNYNGKVLVDFFATWCGPCELLAPILDEVAKENPEIKYYRVDTDQEIDLSSHYRIMYLPTLILFEDGKEINRSIGLVDKDTLTSFLRENPQNSENF